MSTLYVDTINEKTSGNGVYIPGHVVQVVNTVKTDVFTASLNSTRVAITGLSASITPRSTSSKILVMPTLFLSPDVATFQHMYLYRDGSEVTGARGDAAGNRGRDYGMLYTGVNSDAFGQNIVLPTYSDSPSTTSSTTYQIYVGDPNNSGGTFYLNRLKRDDDQVYEPRCISSITLMEIAQ